MIGADARADRGRLPEIERRAFDRRELAGGNQRRVHRREAIRVERELVLQDVAGSGSGEIEVAVLREVDRRRLVGGGVVVDDQLVGRRQRVGDAGVEVAGIAFVAVGADDA